MTPEQKIRASEALYLAAWDLKAAWLRSQYPDLPDDEIQEMVRRLFRDAAADLYARLLQPLRQAGSPTWSPEGWPPSESAHIVPYGDSVLLICFHPA